MTFIPLVRKAVAIEDKLTKFPEVATLVMMIEDSLTRAKDGMEGEPEPDDSSIRYIFGQVRRAADLVDLLRDKFREAMIELREALRVP
jgi:hypothetical protein